MMPPLPLSSYIKFAGWALCGLGLLIALLLGNLYLLDDDVRVEVVSLGQTQSEDGIEYRPLLRVADGPHAGRLTKVQIGSSRKLHSAGDLVDGKYDPLIGWVLSDRILFDFLGLAIVLATMGLFTSGMSWFADLSPRQANYLNRQAFSKWFGWSGTKS